MSNKFLLLDIKNLIFRSVFAHFSFNTTAKEVVTFLSNCFETYFPAHHKKKNSSIFLYGGMIVTTFTSQSTFILSSHFLLLQNTQFVTEISKIICAIDITTTR